LDVSPVEHATRTDRPDSRLIDQAKKWVVDNYQYNSYHLLQSLVWLDRIAPGSSEAVRLATLTHDMERAFPGPDQPSMAGMTEQYYQLHSERSSRTVGEWLRSQSAPEALVTDVQTLIRAHEVGGWPEANLVQAADSLSFLETNVDLFLGFIESGRFTIDDVQRKFDFSYDRIQVPRAKTLALPLLEAANARLDAVRKDRERQSAGSKRVESRR
jgi:hypothetical protein